MTRIPRLLAVSAQPDHWLLVTFDNGERRLFDMKPYLERGVFRRLKDAAVFGLVRIEHGAPAWPGDLDIAPETVYLRGERVGSDGRPPSLAVEQP